jgi:putative transposase
VWENFRRWRDAGTLERVHAALRAQVRVRDGRPPTPSALSLDSLSVNTTEKGGAKVFDVAKRVKGRKRHLCVDTLGLIWALTVHAADLQDRVATKQVLWALRPKRARPRLRVLWADGANLGPLGTWVRRMLGADLVIVRKLAAQPGFVPLPKRWVAERTFAWLGRYRRLSEDYEERPASSATWIYAATTHLRVRRLA